MTEKYFPKANIDFAIPSNEVLNQSAEEVPFEDILTPEVQGLVDEMFKIAYGEQGDTERKTMVGFAAPQLGIKKRIIIAGVNTVGLGEQPELNAYINPEIIEKSTETEESREGCYSTDRVCGIVERSKKITLKAYDRAGNQVTEAYEDLPARISQHEIDHLDGIRFPDRISDDSKLHWVEPERYGEYRQRWREWEVACPRDKWEAIKSDA